ncbi:MAG: DUF4954 family protein [Prevotella sp.]|nr:DUF4954 family protein [Prevotella sp.]
MSDIVDNYRSLTLDEIAAMESQGCTAGDWNTVRVAEAFSPGYVRNVTFCGTVCLGVFDKQIEIGEGFMRQAGIRNAVLRDVTVGDNCLIENIGCYISRYDIAEECYIANVGRMATDDGATYGNGNVVSVLNEAGDGNVIIYDGLTSQMAAFMVAHASDADFMARMRAMVARDVETRRPECGTIGYRVKITNTREIVNTIVGDDCEISGASLISDCTLTGTPEAGTYIGHDVICENTVVAAGASVTDGAKVSCCFIGEACHIGRGFSAENSLFFANSYMANGEACAAFCGPFTVSHHKSTLLIGGMYSFYNAGSGTNFSNHAYKLGPIHYGTLGRGSKTASDAHLLMPATIGEFSMLMGKIENHPDTSALPFSYIIASGGRTHIVPGRNITTVGTWRDTAKWPRRDMRPHGGRRSLVCFDWLSPLTVTGAIRGRHLLESLREEQGEDAAEYVFGDCVIRNSALLKGIRYYDMAIRLYMGEAVKNHYCELPESSVGTGGWTDLAGLLVPESEVELLADDIRSGVTGDVAAVEERFATMAARYEDYKWNWTYRVILDYFGLDTLTEADLQRITDEYEAARRDRNAAIRLDAEREYALGDVEESLLGEFLEKLEDSAGA